MLQRRRKHREKNRDRINRQAREYNATDRGKAMTRRSKIKQKYGITLEEHERIYVDQNGCCALCGKLVAYREVHTDHDHETGEIRGLLCFRCNLGLGTFGDDLEGLRRVMKYLRR